MGERTGLTPVDINDPLFQRKKEIIGAMNYTSGLLHRADDDKNNLILWVIAILLGTLMGGFLQTGNYIGVLIFGIILIILLICFFVKKNDEYNDLWKTYLNIEKQAKENSIDLPENPKKIKFFKLLFEQLF
ncbi:MAG: hypothetical protein WAU65_02695 [Candidatus Nanoarchaeia archaeon]